MDPLPAEEEVALGSQRDRLAIARLGPWIVGGAPRRNVRQFLYTSDGQCGRQPHRQSRNSDCALAGSASVESVLEFESSTRQTEQKSTIRQYALRDCSSTITTTTNCFFLAWLFTGFWVGCTHVHFQVRTGFNTCFTQGLTVLYNTHLNSQW